MPTIVIAHTFCASSDTGGFLLVMLTNTGVFLRGLNYAEKVDLRKYSWYLKRKS